MLLLIIFILLKKADMAVCDLTITSERITAVDFTIPFMNLGIGILAYKPPQDSPDWYFSFFSIQSLGVWAIISTGYIGASLLIYLMSRMPPHPRGEESSRFVLN